MVDQTPSHFGIRGVGFVRQRPDALDLYIRELAGPAPIAFRAGVHVLFPFRVNENFGCPKNNTIFVPRQAF